VEEVKKMTGSGSPIEDVPYEKTCGPRFEDMGRHCSNIEKVRKLIELKQKNDLEAVNQSVVDHFKERRHSGKSDQQNPEGLF
jgi:hypothetical protein